MQQLFATCARGFEELLKQELEALGANECKLTQGGVYFSGDQTLLYRSVLWSRLASRILLPIKSASAFDDMALYLAVKQIDWPSLIAEDASIMVHFTGTNQEIRNSQYGAQRVKDAIVDAYTYANQPRPYVDKQSPDIRIHVFLYKDTAEISLDLSGDSLHLRGYRAKAGAAPLKETLASAIIQRSGWQKDEPMIDPFCGSGTLLIESAMMAADMAPNLYRRHFGFFAWRAHDAEIWQKVKQEAFTRADAGLAALNHNHFYGYDNDPVMIKIARANAEQAGLGDYIQFACQDITELSNPFNQSFQHDKAEQESDQAKIKTGTLLMNPPYGERLHSQPELIALYSQIGFLAKQHFAGWKLSVFTSSEELLSCLQLRADKQFKAKNGPLECIQKNYRLSDKRKSSISTSISTSLSASASTHANGNNAINEETNQYENAQQATTRHIAEDFANRLKKNLQKIDKWAKQEGLTCYRIYDADLPEYNVALDRYGDYVVLQEYAPPKTVDEKKARQRLFDAMNTALYVLNLSPQQLILKTRSRQKGEKQYQRLAQKDNYLQMAEYHAKFWVNLTDYLDTGLFLDHRIARRMIGEMAKGKDFLNLFCYTGSATVYAGLGGAKSTTSVDLSNTYLGWAERNLRLNGLTGKQHQLVQADCLYWLEYANEEFEYLAERGDREADNFQYDLIFVDPPTFSNSKRMHETFDVQRDYIQILQGLKALLRKNGTILFSNNRRGFKLDDSLLAEIGFKAQNITEKTHSLDFARNKQIHQSWLITHSD